MQLWSVQRIAPRRLAGQGHGNTELVVLYDETRETDFKSILKLFGGAKLAPEKALVAKPPQDSQSDATESISYRIVSLRLRSAGRIIEAIIEPSIPAGSLACTRFG